MFGEESSQSRELEKIFGSNREIKPTDDMKALVKELNDVRDMQSKTEEALEKIKEERMYLEDRLYLTLENHGINSIRTKYGTFYRNDNFFANVNKDDKEQLFIWLNKIGASALISSDVHYKKLNNFIKERRSQGEEIPSFVKTFLRPKIGRRKA
jgi:hypothetical protein